MIVYIYLYINYYFSDFLLCFIFHFLLFVIYYLIKIFHIKLLRCSLFTENIFYSFRNIFNQYDIHEGRVYELIFSNETLTDF